MNCCGVTIQIKSCYFVCMFVCLFFLIFHKGKFGLFSVKKIDCWPLQKQKKRRRFRLITWSRL